VNLYLPRVTTEGEKTPTTRRPVAVNKQTGETILLVEDNPDVRRVTARRLQNLGYRVVEADSGARAIELLKAGAKVDLVFSDVVMPGGISGFELVHWVGENIPAARVLLTSGFAEDVARAGEAPAPELEILRKPYSGVDLARALRKAIDGS
jgi:CheY-like chemotaxis protein